MEAQAQTLETQNQAQPSPTQDHTQLETISSQLHQQLPPAQSGHEHAPAQPSPLSTVPPITPGAPDDASFEQDSQGDGDAFVTTTTASFRSPVPIRGGRGRGVHEPTHFIPQRQFTDGEKSRARWESRRPSAQVKWNPIEGRSRCKSYIRPFSTYSNIKIAQDDSEEEEFTMEGIKTKSGRKVHRPTQFDPAAKTPTRRRGPYRRFHDSRICRICQRGHSPQSNMIVFCDGCNTPYHQLCHDPPIDDLVIAVADAEWFCKECSSKRTDRPLVIGMSGATLTEEEKRTYFASLPMGSLVELLFFAEKMHPDLQLYDPNTKAIVADIKAAASAHDVPIKGTPAKGTVFVNGDAIAPGARGRASIDYEELIIRALAAINDPVGVQPKFIWEWLKSYEKSVEPVYDILKLTISKNNRNYTHVANREVRTEAQNPLQKLLRLNRIIREGHQYRVNYEHPANSFVSASAGASPLSRVAASNHVNHRAHDTTSASSQESPTGMLLPGAGIKLPPENMDDTGLVEDEADRAFSHRWSTGIVGVVTVNTTSIGGRDVVMTDGGDDVDAEGIDDVMT